MTLPCVDKTTNHEWPDMAETEKRTKPISENSLGWIYQHECLKGCGLTRTFSKPKEICPESVT
jgi:hypothetical protein